MKKKLRKSRVRETRRKQELLNLPEYRNGKVSRIKLKLKEVQIPMLNRFPSVCSKCGVEIAVGELIVFFGYKQVLCKRCAKSGGFLDSTRGHKKEKNDGNNQN